MQSCYMFIILFFFFKQKTAYEMRISDWSSDVCSSDLMAQRLGLPMSKVVCSIERHANTSAASVPLAFDEAVRDGRIKPGHLVLMEAIGGEIGRASGRERVCQYG